MSQITERYVRNFIRGFNEAFADADIDPLAHIVTRGGTSLEVLIGNRLAWFADDGTLCGPPELLRELDEEREWKDTLASIPLANPKLDDARATARLQAAKQVVKDINTSVKPAMDMSLLSVPEED